MFEALDDLPGLCHQCGEGPVLIDGNGVEPFVYWAYCDRCGRCSHHGQTPNEVYELWASQK